MGVARRFHLDLCSGVGGFALAAQWAGYTTIGFVEIDPWCRRVLAKNFPGVPMHDDLKTLEGHRVRQWIAETEPRLRHEGSAVADAPPMQRTAEQRHQPDRNHDEPRTDGLGGIPQHDDLKTLTAATVRRWIGAGSAVGDPLLADAEHAGQPVPAPGHSDNQQRAGRTEEAGGVVEPARGDHRQHLRTLDLLTAGYPCQPFSLAGKRMGAEDDRHLWPFIAALVAELRPRRCLFENVYGHVSMGLDAVLSDLEALGYACGAVVVPACAVGAPHRRDRVWILADAGSDGHRADANSHQPPSRRATTNVATISTQGTSNQRGSTSSDQREALSGMGIQTDGLPGFVVGPERRDPWAGDWEAGCPRVTTHEQDRTHKLKALGNAIVPQVAYEILRHWGQP